MAIPSLKACVFIVSQDGPECKEIPCRDGFVARKRYRCGNHVKMHNKTQKDYEKASLLLKGKYVIIGLPNWKGVVLYGKGIAGSHSGK